MSKLSATISAGDYQLDSILQSIAEAAQKLTGATGAAIASWKDGAVVCRASCGEGAPPLGAHLSVESGISGHCLRSGLIQHCGETQTDPRVDAELCRHLGLRSVVVVPIRGWRGVSGILEVFSIEPRAFAECHFAVLEKLAALAERARAGQPHTAVTVAAKITEPTPNSGLLPASDRVRDLASVLLGKKNRPFLLGAIAVVGFLLIGIAIWLGWRNPDGIKMAKAAPPLLSGANAAGLDSDPVWKANPGGEILFSSKRSPRKPIEPSGKADVNDAGSERQSRTNATSSKDDGNGPEAVIHYENPAAAGSSDSSFEGSQPAADSGPPVIASAGLNSASLSNVLSASVSRPQLVSVPISQGLSEGYLIHRVDPVYPAQALMTRLEGSVVLDALIAEDGAVQDLKVVQGQPTLARAALQAVRQWRYKPYQLNRKPVKMNTTITVNFKLP